MLQGKLKVFFWTLKTNDQGFGFLTDNVTPIKQQIPHTEPITQLMMSIFWSGQSWRHLNLTCMETSRAMWSQRGGSVESIAPPAKGHPVTFPCQWGAAGAHEPHEMSKRMTFHKLKHLRDHTSLIIITHPYICGEHTSLIIIMSCFSLTQMRVFNLGICWEFSFI